MQKKEQMPSLKEIRENLKLSQEAFAEKLGVSRVLINRVENGQLPISAGLEKKLNEYLGSYNSKNVYTLAEESNKKHYKSNSNDSRVPLYDNIVASAGKVSTVNESHVETKIQLGDVFKDATGAMWVHGHSMYPDYENGCMVGFREIRDKSLISYNEVYIVVTKEYCLLKRLRKGTRADAVLAVSENKDFETFEIKRDQIINLYLVLGKISRAQMSTFNFN